MTKSSLAAQSRQYCMSNACRPCRDLVQKHYSAHHELRAEALSRPSDSMTSPGRAQQFTAMACSSCAQTKTRCDRRIPCGRCYLRGIACVPRTPRRGPATISMSTALTAPSARVSLDSVVVDTLMPDASPTPSQDANQQRKAEEEVSSPGSTRSASSGKTGGDEDEERSNPDGQISEEDMATIPLEFDTVAADAFDLGLFSMFDETESIGNLDWMSLLDTPSLLEPEQHEILSSEQQCPEDGVWLTLEMSSNTVTLANAPTGRTHSISFHGGAGIFTPSGPEMLSDNTAASVDNTNMWLNKVTSTSKAGDEAIGDADAVVDEHSRSDVDSWNICQCNPASRTTNSLRRGELVTRWTEEIDPPNTGTMSCGTWRNNDFKAEKAIKRLDLSEITRERMLGTMQEIFRRALELYALPSNRQRDGALRYPRRSRRCSYSLPLLPSTSTLHEYLEVFLTNFEPLHPVISKGTLDPNELVPNSTEDTSSLTFFLMIAYGMIRDTDVSRRRIAVGLLDACQISLMDLVERETQTPRPNVTFLSTSLCTFQAAFSGDKWLMDSSQGLRTMYLGVSLAFASRAIFLRLEFPSSFFSQTLTLPQMAKFYSLFERHRPYSARVASIHDGLESIWKSWMHRETSSRCVQLRFPCWATNRSAY